MISAGVVPAPDYLPDGWLPGVVGVHAGGCVRYGPGIYPTDSSEFSDAHAHIERTDPYSGWVCFRSVDKVFDTAGLPTYLLVHELAHAALRQGHTGNWVKVMRAFGFEERPVARSGGYTRSS